MYACPMTSSPMNWMVKKPRTAQDKWLIPWIEKWVKVNQYCLVCNLSLERDNGSLVVVYVAPRLKFNAKESIGWGTGAPCCQRSNEWEGAFGVSGEGGSGCVWGSNGEISLLKKSTKHRNSAPFYLTFDLCHEICLWPRSALAGGQLIIMRD